MNVYGVGLEMPHANARREAQADRMAPRDEPGEAVHMRFGQFELDEANARLLRGGQAVMLAPRPFALLCALARRPGTLRTKNDLLDEVWGHRFVTESVLKTAIGKLRSALQDNAREPRFIETVARRGYRFIATGSGTTSAAEGDVLFSSDGSGIFPEHVLRQIKELLQSCAGDRPLMLLFSPR